MREYRVGIVGLGWVAGAHLETFKSVNGAKVTAVCSRRKQDPAALEKQYGVPLKAYTDFDRMLADPDIDIIDICTPHPFHAQQAIAAAQAGKHLVIEKPICLTWKDARAMRQAIRNAGVKVCVCFECRFSAHFTLVRAMVEQGMFGDLHYGEADYLHGIGPWYGQFPWNVKKDFGGSSLLTAGCHALDGLLYFMNEEVVEVTSYATRSTNPDFAPYEYPTTAATLLRFKSGKVGKVGSVIDCVQPYHLRVYLVGSKGSVLDDKFYTTQLPGLDKKKWSTLGTALVDSGDVHDHPYQAQFQAFVDSLRKNETMPRTDFDTALESHRVVFAADLSAAEGRSVKLSELT